MKTKTKKTSPRATKPARITWTFQPADDVAALVDTVFPDMTRGQRTELINEAVRQKYTDAAIAVQERKLAVEQVNLDNLIKTVKSKSSSNQIDSAAAKKLTREYAAQQKQALPPAIKHGAR